MNSKNIIDRSSSSSDINSNSTYIDNIQRYKYYHENTTITTEYTKNILPCPI